MAWDGSMIWELSREWKFEESLKVLIALPVPEHSVAAFLPPLGFLDQIF
jgi:hypothetical protein